MQTEEAIGSTRSAPVAELPTPGLRTSSAASVPLARIVKSDGSSVGLPDLQHQPVDSSVLAGPVAHGALRPIVKAPAALWTSKIIVPRDCQDELTRFIAKN